MELKEIKFIKNNLETTMEENAGGSYSISVYKKSEEPSERDERILDFRTDEVDISDLIESLKFCKDYNFIQ